MYEVNIDFDEASKCWKQNKIKLNDGCYKYKKERCIALTKNGAQCKHKTSNTYCSLHKNLMYK
jgi:hypothetical protein